MIDRDSVVTGVRLVGCEGTLDYASAALYGPGGVEDYLYYYGSRVDYLTTYAGVKPGVYKTTDGSGFDASSDPVNWSYTSTTIKFGTRAGIALARSGGNVNITVAAYRYAAYQGFIGYGNRVIGVQHSTSASGPWSVIAYANVNAAGRVTIAKYAPAARYYRAFFGDSGSFFGSYSAPARA